MRPLARLVTAKLELDVEGEPLSWPLPEVASWACAACGVGLNVVGIKVLGEFFHPSCAAKVRDDLTAVLDRTEERVA